MRGLLRKLLMWICCPIYKLIPKIYDIFFTLANGNNLFGDDMIQSLSANMYVLISVVMLFALSVNILAAIVNPDLLNDKKKGVAAMFKRFIIGLILIILIPFGFNYAYEVQYKIMSNNLIEKVVVGINFTGENNGGQVIAGTLVAAVIYPVENELSLAEDVDRYYTGMVSENIDYISDFADYINVSGEGSQGSYEYAFEFESLIALIAGIAICYILLLFSIDMAVRVFKLFFLELTAPISIIAYMALGDDYLKKWGAEVGKTYGQVFVKIVCMAFYLFLIAHLSEFLENLDGAGNFFLKVLLIVGMLIFVKQIPDIISKVFGINFKTKGGISGRLGEMAAVGNTAKKAWDGLRKATTSTLKLAGAGAAAGVGYGLYKGTNALSHGRVEGLKDRIANNEKVQGVGSVVKAIGSGVSSGGGFKGLKKANETYKESKLAKQRKLDKDNQLQDQIREDAGINDAGRMVDANGNILNADSAGLAAINRKYDKYIDKVKNSRLLPSRAKEALINKIKADKTNAQMQEMKKLNSDIISDLTTLSANTTGDTQIKLENLKSDYARGKISFSELTSRLQSMVDSKEISEGIAGSITTKANKYESMVLNADNDLIRALGYSVVFSTDSAGNVLKDANGLNVVTSIANNKISARATDQQKIADAAKQAYDSEEALLSGEYKTVASTYNSVASDMASEQTRITEGVTKNNSINPAPSPNPTPSPNPAPSQSTQSAYTDSEYHDKRQEEYENLFNSQEGIDYLNVNESYDTNWRGVQSRPYNQDHYDDPQQQTSSQSSQGDGNNSGSTIINNYNSSGSEDMSSYFDGLSKDIRDASESTNKILSDQLDTQQNILKENQTQNQNLTSINSELKKANKNITNVNNSVNSLGNKLRNNDLDE